MPEDSAFVKCISTYPLHKISFGRNREYNAKWMAGGDVVNVVTILTQRGMERIAHCATIANAGTVMITARRVTTGEGAGHQEVSLQLHRLPLTLCWTTY